MTLVTYAEYIATELLCCSSFIGFFTIEGQYIGSFASYG